MERGFAPSTPASASSRSPAPTPHTALPPPPSPSRATPPPPIPPPPTTISCRQRCLPQVSGSEAGATAGAGTDAAASAVLDSLDATFNAAPNDASAWLASAPPRHRAMLEQYLPKVSGSGAGAAAVHHSTADDSAFHGTPNATFNTTSSAARASPTAVAPPRRPAPGAVPGSGLALASGSGSSRRQWTTAEDFLNLQRSRPSHALLPPAPPPGMPPPPPPPLPPPPHSRRLAVSMRSQGQELHLVHGRLLLAHARPAGRQAVSSHRLACHCRRMCTCACACACACAYA